jgi:hypothetical protein
MSKTVFYKKVGRRYIPVSEYDNELLDSFPKGTHLVQCYPGGSSRRFNIDPAYAPMIAAGRVAEDVISKALMRASDLRPQRAPITEAQRAAWDNLVKEMGEEARCLQWPSAREACEEAVKAMSVEAEKLLTNPSVRKAYERFLLICELTKEHNETAK